MVGKRDYRRWEYSDETEISAEEQLSLEDHEQHNDDPMHSSTSTTTTFSQPSLLISTCRTHHGKRLGKITTIKGKVQLLSLSAGVLLVGFIAGFAIGVRNKASPLPGSRNPGKLLLPPTPSPPAPLPSLLPPLSWPSSSSSHEVNDSSFQKLVGQITAENIRRNLKRMSQEVHMPGTTEGRSMGMAIRDLWRSYGLSVRVEQHKTVLTRTTGFNFVEALDGNGSSMYRSSLVGDDINLPNARPFLAFSPPADFNGTLIYGHYGTVEDFEYLEDIQVPLNGSIALVRFGDIHPSKIAATAGKFGIGGIVFYPDPGDFGPEMPSTAIRRTSLLTLGQIHEYQKRKAKLTIPCHSISANDAEYFFRLMMLGGGGKTPKEWKGGLNVVYSLGGVQQAHLRLFNEPKSSSIYNVVAAIPGAWESDRYIIVGCSHDSWTYGAGDPGIGLAILTEIARVFATAVTKGWKTRRSILFISWDGNLYASSGVSHWLQEHHFEISSRAVAYIDLTRILQGNETLRVYSSPVLREVVKKAIARVKHFDTIGDGEGGGKREGGSEGISGPFSQLDFSSTLSSDEPSFAFLGNLGIPFIRPTVVNSPKDFDYPLFQTSFDTFENFRRLVDPSFSGAESLGRIISAVIVLLADSSLLPMNIEDYVEEIQKAFGNFMAHYQEDLHKANLSIAYLQAAVMRLEVIGDNFRTEMHNRSVIINNDHEHEPPSAHQVKAKKLLFHRIINDKIMEMDRAFLSRRSDVFKHLVLGYSSCSWIPSSGMEKGGRSHGNCSVSYDQNYNNHFSKLREALECGRRMERFNNFDDYEGTVPKEGGARYYDQDDNDCKEWKAAASQEVTALIRGFDAAAALLQSPLLPEESDSAST